MTSRGEPMQASDASIEHARRDWRPLLGAFFLGWVFMYADRSVFSPVVGQIQEEFGVSLTQIGLLSSAFFLAYAVLQVPFGLAAERVGRKILLVSGFTLFGLSTVVSGFAGSFLLLVAFGVVTGVGQATYYPTQFSISAETIPKRNRALGLAIVNNGMAVGVAGGTILAAWLAFGLELGWRTSLITMGVMTVLTAALMGRVVWEPPRPSKRVPLKISASLSKAQLATYVAGFCSLFGFFVILVWLPYYLQTTRNIGATDSGFVSALAAIPAIPAALWFSHRSDRNGSRLGTVYVLFIASAAALVAVAFAPNFGLLLVALVIYGLSGKLVADPLLVAHLADITSPTAYATTYALFNFAGMAASVIAPIVAAVLAQLTGDVAPAFVLAAVFLTLGVFVLRTWGGISETSD